MRRYNLINLTPQFSSWRLGEGKQTRLDASLFTRATCTMCFCAIIFANCHVSTRRLANLQHSRKISAYSKSIDVQSTLLSIHLSSNYLEFWRVPTVSMLDLYFHSSSQKLLIVPFILASPIFPRFTDEKTASSR